MFPHLFAMLATGTVSTPLTPCAIDQTVRLACDYTQARWRQPPLVFDGVSWLADGCTRLIYGAELRDGSPQHLVIEASTDQLHLRQRELAADDLNLLGQWLGEQLGIDVQVIDPWGEPLSGRRHDTLD